MSQLDPCIHGPGVERCGHPDCIGYRAYRDGTMVIMADQLDDSH